MRKYLVVFEAPCVGLNEELVQFETDKQVSDWAWATSVNTREYIPGSYTIYHMTYDNHLQLHLEEVDEIALWAEEGEKICATGADHGYWEGEVE